MPEIQRDNTVHFDVFKFDLSTGELHKNGRCIRLQGQPSRLLALLLSRPKELVSRSEIQNALWPDGRFVEFEHAINTAMKKVREALEDDPDHPRFIETIPKQGYRFLQDVAIPEKPPESGLAQSEQSTPNTSVGAFALPHPRLCRFLFLMIQVGYLAIYCGALYFMPELEEVLTSAGFVPVRITFPAILILAMCGIAIRLYLLSAVGWRHPAARAAFLRMFPLVFVLDACWAASPLLATRVLGAGIALAGVAGMAYLPFAQRTLIRSVDLR